MNICTRIGKPRERRKCGTVRVTYSANLFGNRIQFIQSIFRQLAGFLGSELGVRRYGVPDQFDTVDKGRLERRR